MADHAHDDSREVDPSTIVSPAPDIVSVDDHLIEPAHLWETWLPAGLQARGPKAVETPDGVFWEVAGQRVPLSRLAASAGRDLADRKEVAGHWDDMRPGCYEPHARVDDMDADGVLASLCFPSMPGFGGTVFNTMPDRELGLACIRVYNDFQTEEWAGAEPGRLFAMVLLPYWDPALAVAEIQRTKAAGAVAITFTENPYRQGFPSIHDADRYWDPVFAAAADAEMPLCLHFGSSSHTLSPAPDSPRIVQSVTGPLNSQLAFIDWIMSGVFERHPGLQVVYSESYLGWLPFVVEHCDRHWANHFAWAIDHESLPHPPSEYFHRNVSVCLVYDEFGASQIENIGVDRVLAEADYPHPDSQWPNTRKVLEEQLAHLSPSDRRKVLRTNAERLFHLEPRAPLSVNVTRVFADDTGATHVQTVTLAELGPVPDRTPSDGLVDVPATTIAITGSRERRPAWDIHPPPRRQLLVVLQGAFEVTATDGNRARIEAGDCLLVDDVGSAGHAFADVGDERLVTVQIGIDPAWRWPLSEGSA